MIVEALYYRIRLLMHRHKESYSAFYKMLGFCPHRISLYEQALTHRSAASVSEGSKTDNERLEFLGDAIFTAVTVDYLFRTFPDKKEGFLSNSRSRIIQRETLNRVAAEIGLDKIVYAELRTVAHHNYVYGNAFEALIGAIYLDRGYKRCRRFIIEKIFKPHIDLNEIIHTDANFKSKLVEWAQHYHVDIAWRLDGSTVDDDNSPLFKVRAIVGGREGMPATGYSKKEAEQAASRLALQQLHTDAAFRDSVLHAPVEKDEENDGFIEKTESEQA